MPKAVRLIAGLATMFFATSLVACSGSGSGGGAIATVNGQEISKADFDNKLESSPAAIGTLQQMVRDQLILQYAKQNNITVSDAEIAAREDELKANFPNGWCVRRRQWRRECPASYRRRRKHGKRRRRRCNERRHNGRRGRFWNSDRDVAGVGRTS